MIPTRLKARLPWQLSYPIGAEAISLELAGAPHVDSLSVTFEDQVVWRPTEFRSLLSERLPYKIMAATYRPPLKHGISASNASMEGGFYDEKWELCVYPVLREFRHLANRLLREQGLPAIARWLRSSNRAGWVERSQHIDLVFSPTGESLTVLESSGV